MLNGWRRSLCVYSHVYRGTPDRPGLVLGLDLGGSCAGVAFQVEAALREKTIRYLREREQVTAVYVERKVSITLESGERVGALTYVADRLHPQYAGRLTREATLELVRGATGQSGDNPAYVIETYDHLLAIGVRDRDLGWLSARLRGDVC
jgi:glutathione-specific gamma-glutamylcyclotransferase